MNAKENALRILRFDQPEKITQGPPVYTLSYHGCNHEPYGSELGDDHPVGAWWTDIWGTGWHKVHADVMGLPKICPLAEMDALKTYRFPDPDDERIIGRLDRMTAQFPGGDVFLGGSHRDTLWEKAYMLVGMENMMIYFHPEYAREVLHRIMDFQLGIARHYLRLGVEFVHLGDDLGSQGGLLLSPKILQEFFVPEYERLFQFYRQHGVLIGFHSCGRIEAALEMFIQLGVDVLNPLQATANNLETVRRKTQGKMALQGGISSGLIMAGPPERIEQEVRFRLWQLGREGGYFCAPDQGMPYPAAHLEALAKAVEQYGCYPLQPPV